MCSKESNTLCNACFLDVFDEPHEVCFLCGTLTIEGRVCVACARNTRIAHAWIAGTYDGSRRDLIRAYKFERKRAAYKPLAQAILATLPYLEDVIVVPVPTAPRRIRVRGYDHVKLLARYIAKEKGLEVSRALRRRHNDRQVGSTRAQRFRQAQTAYEVIDARAIVGKHVLLVDDVTTSGATLQAAAELLTKAGAKEVDAAVIAKHTLTS